jgi:acyl-CoA dehydrogenase
MSIHVTSTPAGSEKQTESRVTASHIPGDCRGLNFYALDPALRRLLALYLPADVRTKLEPHFDRLGALAGGRLDELAAIADKNPPVLHPRDRQGRDEDWIEYHPAYREMEQIAFGDFQFHAMSHRGGVLGLDAPLPPVAKYALTYLFVQAEFGIMCPVSVTETSTYLIRKYASPELKDFLLPRMLSADMATFWKGTQFMTEKAGGSDVGAVETVARQVDGPANQKTWRVWGDKWFCSHTDADVALMLARPEGAPAGTKGLALFALPRRLPDGSRNSYRIVRLKDKLGTRSMASGEIVLDGAVVYPVGRLDQGLKQMMDQVNLSRLSHGVRAAAMMRRCLNEALHVARQRVGFGKPIIEHVLLRRQLMKLMVPTEQALSMTMLAAKTMGTADTAPPGSESGKDAIAALRILTPLVKFRACRDNIPVATGAMEVRGGVGYIEEWVNARLIRDAHVGVLWEGTSNINGLDVIQRAVGKEQAHKGLQAIVQPLLRDLKGLPAAFVQRLDRAFERAIVLAESVAASATGEPQARRAASALYHATSAILLAWEGTRPHASETADARRVLLARFVLDHRLAAQDPLALEDAAWEQEATALLLDARPVSLAKAGALVVA